MPTDAPWSLHSQLKKDTIDIGDLPLCKVLVIKDAHYPWLLLVPRREGAVEIIDLDEVAQAQLMTEISRVSRALKEITKCDKLNVAALGNLVPQLHVHIIARRTSDAAWPRPVWGVMPPLAHDAEEVSEFHQRASPQDLVGLNRCPHSTRIHWVSPLSSPTFSIGPRICGTNDEKLFAMEARAMRGPMWSTATRWSVKQEAAAPRAALDQGGAWTTAPIPARSFWACATARRSSGWAFRRPPP
jgi:diadenosine tetraphosphate (Ap4A) HIT family hydrolase